MTKIIDKKRYNTETATLIGEWANGAYRGDFNRVEETLYRTSRGVYFLHVYGPTGYSGARLDIAPMSREEAFIWASEKDIDTIEDHFSDLIEDA